MLFILLSIVGVIFCVYFCLYFTNFTAKYYFVLSYFFSAMDHTKTINRPKSSIRPITDSSKQLLSGGQKKKNKKLLINSITNKLKFLKIPTPHPWPSFTPLGEHYPTNQMLDPCFSSSSMPHQPLTFPNLVNSFERNPQHAARAALYTRYTPGEWQHSNVAAYTESDINRFE